LALSRHKVSFIAWPRVHLPGFLALQSSNNGALAFDDIANALELAIMDVTLYFFA
jgi:hypothetical protein